MSQTKSSQTEFALITATGFTTPIALADVASNSVNGINAYTTVNSNSANWYSPYTINNSTSAINTLRGGNISSGNYSLVASGSSNNNSGNFSNVTGGLCNTMSGLYSNINGGWGNINSGYSSIISGGACSCASGQFSIINGGWCNTASACDSIIGGGTCNLASGCFSIIAGGFNNIASGCSSFIAGGWCNNTKGYANTFIIGSGLSATQANTLYANNIISNGSITGFSKVNNQTTNTAYFLTSSDSGNIIYSTATSAANLTATLQPISYVYPDGFEVTFIQLNTGRIFLSGGSIAINQANGYFKTTKQYSAATLVYIGGSWIAFGDLNS